MSSFLEMQSDKKILFICGGTAVFGVERITLRIMEELHRKGYKVYCLASGWNNGIFIKELERIGVPYSTMKLGWIYLRKWKWTLDTVIHIPGAIRRFRHLVRSWQPDVMIYSSIQPVFLLYPFLKGKVIYHVHDTLSGIPVFKKILTIVDRKVDKYIAISNFIRKDLEECGISSSKIQVVHNFVSDISKSRSVKHNHQPLNIGIIGQIADHKGHHILIEALTILNKKSCDFCLEIIGEGSDEYKKYLKQTIQQNGLEDKIVWRGYVDNEREIYKNLDIVVIPSICLEAFGLVAIEPAKYEIPVVASNSGALPEIIADQESGYLFNTGDSRDLANKIELFIKNPKLVQEMGRKASDRLMQHFVADIKLRQLEQAILN